MRAIIFILAVLSVIAANATVPFSIRCMEFINSTGPYTYCNATTNTSQNVDNARLDKLVVVLDDVLDDLGKLCEEHEKVSL